MTQLFTRRHFHSKCILACSWLLHEREVPGSKSDPGLIGETITFSHNATTKNGSQKNLLRRF